MEQAINDADERDRVEVEAGQEAVGDLNDICQQANEVTEVVEESLGDRARARPTRSIRSNVGDVEDNILDLTRAIAGKSMIRPES